MSIMLDCKGHIHDRRGLTSLARSSVGPLVTSGPPLCHAQCVKGGGVRKMFFFRENQRFVLVNWVKLLNVQPWGPRLSDGEQNYGQKTAIFGHI